MKKLVSLFLCFLMLFSLSACDLPFEIPTDVLQLFEGKRDDTTTHEATETFSMTNFVSGAKKYFAKIEKMFNPPKELSAEEVYDRCSPAVFYLELYDEDDEVISSGSGFFIEQNGIAITNYHVVEGGHSAKIMIPGTEEVYDVSGIYDYDKDYDWAVIQIDGSGFSTLEIGSDDTVQGGATVYAIGSPLGLQNTISNGLISNTNRMIDDIPYIQTSAAISHGSSGGALINKYGKVIGITSAGITEGENLGLALPVSLVSNHKTENLVTLAELSAGNHSTQDITIPTVASNDREAALGLLTAVIDTLENEKISGKPAYTERENTDNGYIEYSILKNEDDTIDVITWEIYDDDYYYTSLTLEPSSDTMPVYYSYNLEGDPYYFQGYAQIYAPEFTVLSDIHFVETKGNADQDVNESICHGNVRAGLDFVQRIFDELRSLSDFDLSDLGFESY